MADKLGPYANRVITLRTGHNHDGRTRLTPQAPSHLWSLVSCLGYCLMLGGKDTGRRCSQRLLTAADLRPMRWSTAATSHSSRRTFLSRRRVKQAKHLDRLPYQLRVISWLTPCRKVLESSSAAWVSSASESLCPRAFKSCDGHMAASTGLDGLVKGHGDPYNQAFCAAD